MELNEALEILSKYNEWRRGAGIKQPSPDIIGIAIDTVIEELTRKR